MVLVAPTIKKIWPCIQRSKYGWWRLELSKIEKKHTTAILAQKCENIKNTKTKPKTHAKEIIVKNKAKCKKFFWGTEKEGNTNAPKKSCEVKIQENWILQNPNAKTHCEVKIAPIWILCKKIQKVTILFHSETGW